jgi:hypothetical protein
MTIPLSEISLAFVSRQILTGQKRRKMSVIGRTAVGPIAAKFMPFCFAPKCCLTLTRQTCRAFIYPDPASIFSQSSRTLRVTKSALKISIQAFPIMERTLSAMGG